MNAILYMIILPSVFTIICMTIFEYFTYKSNLPLWKETEYIIRKFKKDGNDFVKNYRHKMLFGEINNEK